MSLAPFWARAAGSPLWTWATWSRRLTMSIWVSASPRASRACSNFLWRMRLSQPATMSRLRPLAATTSLIRSKPGRRQENGRVSTCPTPGDSPSSWVKTAGSTLGTMRAPHSQRKTPKRGEGVLSLTACDWFMCHLPQWAKPWPVRRDRSPRTVSNRFCRVPVGHTETQQPHPMQALLGTR